MVPFPGPRTECKNVSLLQKDNVSWLCCKCDSCNVDSFTYHSFEQDISNRYEILNSRRLSSVDIYSPQLTPPSVHLRLVAQNQD